MIIKSPVGNLEICDNGNAITSVSITDKAVNSEKTVRFRQNVPVS